MCKCDVCNLMRKYQQAVRKNDKKYLMSFLDHYLEVAENGYYYEMKYRELKGDI